MGSLMSQGNTDLEQGNYAKAVSSYAQVLEGGEESIALYLNLGKAYYEQDSFAKALLTFERGLKRYAHQKDLKNNLEVVNDQRDTEIIPIEDFFLQRWWKRSYTTLSADIWGTLTLLILLVLVVGIYLRLFGNGKLKRMFSNTTFTALILVFFFCFVNGRSKRYVEDNYTQAILLKSASLMTAPDKRSDRAYQLTPGEKLQILDQIGQWYKVALLNKQIGWVHKDQIGMI